MDEKSRCGDRCRDEVERLMEKLRVHGGVPLEGTVEVSGSKNASLPILAATLLTREPCVIRHVPDVSDANYMLQILNRLGASVERASGTVTVEAADISPVAPYDLVRKMRASVCVMGPLVARLGEAQVSLPGGCVIGDRPVDLHLRGLEGLGAEVQVQGGYVHVRAPNGMDGRELNLRGRFGSTVLGTANVMMAAVLARGTTLIESAASEPEVVDLARFLRAMGARIEGEGTRLIVVEGVRELHGAEHEVIPDRIEAGTFLVAGAMAGKEVVVKRADPAHLTAIIDVLRASGHGVEALNGRITVRAGSQPRGARIITEPFPGFPTDMQAQLTALLAVTPGVSAVVDKVFPDRFMHVPELIRMGAQIEREGNTALIEGVERLSAAPVMASDLRASAALVLAGLLAEGVTEIHRVYHIDRGYEHIDLKLGRLGAEIERIRE